MKRELLLRAKILKLLISLILFSSCSSFDIEKSKELGSALSKVDFNIEGKGKISYRSQKHLFSFESLLDESINLWKLGLYIPIHGDELLTLDYSEIKNKKYIASGKIYERLLNSLHQNLELGPLTDLFLKKISVFLDFYENLKMNKNICFKNECHYLKNKFKYQILKNGDIAISSTLNTSYSFVFEATHLNEYYERIAFYLRKNEVVSHKSDVISLKLYISSTISAVK